MLDAHFPIRARLRMRGKQRPGARLKVPMPVKSLWDSHDAAERGGVNKGMRDGCVSCAPRVYAALERHDTDA
eukprot:13066067-Alexandrium_andersonii.AAC.1